MKETVPNESPVLIPLVSKRENDPLFLNEALQGIKQVILLLIVDTNNSSKTFGFNAMEISQGSALMEDAAKIIGQKKKKCDTILQWGDTFTVIDHIAKLKQCSFIKMIKQDDENFEKLYDKLKYQKAYKVLLFEFPKQETEET
ncbi:MAG: hypothetical protein AABW72_06220 [archaeon]